MWRLRTSTAPLVSPLASNSAARSRDDFHVVRVALGAPAQQPDEILGPLLGAVEVEEHALDAPVARELLQQLLGPLDGTGSGRRCARDSAPAACPHAARFLRGRERRLLRGPGRHGLQ